MTKTLDDILSDETPETETQPRDEAGRFAPIAAPEPEAEPETGVTEAAPAPEPEAQPESGPPPQVAEPEAERVPFAALRDERHKRQQLEVELAFYKAQITQPQPPQQQVQPEPQAVPDRWEDPEGYDRWLIRQAAEEARREALETMQIERVKQTALAARNKYQDFDETVGTFQQLAVMNPALEQMMLQQPDPAEWAYNTAKMHREVTQHGSFEAAVAARVEAELAKRTQAPAAAPILPKPTLADAQSARTSAPLYAPKTLSEILASR